MTIRSFEGHVPQIDATAYVDDSAVVSGDVVIAENVSVWPCTVIRGDVNYIRIGARSNVQDGSVLHVTHANPEYTSSNGYPLIIGEDVTIGHKALLHACTIGDRCLIGMGALVMDNVVVEDEVMIAAGSVVPPGKRLTSGHLYIGNPAIKKRPLTDKEREFLSYSASNYVKLAQRTKIGG
ncbi:MAG: gamma carbonic anhydrase family protein [Proteobacteria bacterium]|nr:MAG: gamma carbonic anhydrase family protein [Pseudomonadota bacterium]